MKWGAIAKEALWVKDTYTVKCFADFPLLQGLDIKSKTDREAGGFCRLLCLVKIRRFCSTNNHFATSISVQAVTLSLQSCLERPAWTKHVQDSAIYNFLNLKTKHFDSFLFKMTTKQCQALPSAVVCAWRVLLLPRDDWRGQCAVFIYLDCCLPQTPELSFTRRRIMWGWTGMNRQLRPASDCASTLWIRSWS